VTMKRERHKQWSCKADNTDESHRGGRTRSSEEGIVMMSERRGSAIKLTP
jgi:hypothetical protein